MARRIRREGLEPEAGAELLKLIECRMLPLERDRDLDPLLDRIGGGRLVLLGEASHGTAGFYDWRAAISRRLIVEHGFDFIAVEGDWPACDRVDRYVRRADPEIDDARDALDGFRRWPTWMWANEEIARLADWLRSHNDRQPAGSRVGFHGLDVYSLWESLAAVLGYLRKHDPEALDAARRAFRCFEPFGEDAIAYARAHRLVGESCEDEVVTLLARLARSSLARKSRDPEGAFLVEQNAEVVKNAEAYYRIMVRGGPDSWNLRDTHMMDTLDRLLEHRGPESRGIVWAHNTHVGDARFTDMADEGMLNLGQLARERRSAEGVVLVGFSTHRGTVVAGREWDAPMEVMDVPPARLDSWDDLLHRADPGDALLLFDGQSEPRPLFDRRGQRAIGVVYRPEFEHLGNYVPTELPRRYDALLHLDQTEALHPIPIPTELDEVPEAFPSGR